MTSAEGGMIVTNDDRLATEARLYRDQGKASFSENSHIRMGNNWRLSEPHAIIGLRHLQNLAAMLQSRRAIGARYTDALSARDLGLAPLDVPTGCAPNYYKYIVRLSKAPDRPALKRWLRSEHQVTLAGEVYETPLQLSPVFHELDTGDLDGSRTACAQHLCLPMFASMTEQEVGRVVTALEAARSAGHI
jgi:dTDP-4-amino-4,6-dideoxygalactose transaminase